MPAPACRPTTRSPVVAAAPAPRRSASARGAPAPPRSRCCRTDLPWLEARSGDGRAARSPPPSTASSSGVASTGQMLTLSRAASSGDTNLPRSISTTTWVEMIELVSAAPAIESGVDRGRVVHAGADEDATAVLERFRAQREAAAGKLGADALPDRDRAQLDTLLSGLMTLAAGAEKAQGGGQLGGRLGVGHALDPGVVEGARALGGVGRRVDDPERGGGGVLGRVRACTDRARSPRTAATRTSSSRRSRIAVPSAQQLADARVEAGRVHGRPGARSAPPASSSVQADPAAARVVLVDHRPPHRHRHLELSRAAPGRPAPPSAGRSAAR